jgi:DNA (cytosine-5)-methyltransferase 1
MDLKSRIMHVQVQNEPQTSEESGRKSICGKFAIFSFFSGVGFLDHGFENAGYDIVFVNEIFEPFLDAYKFARQELRLNGPLYGYHCDDIRSLLDSSEDGVLRRKIISAAENYELIGFIGGPPCPDFSVGGKNRGQSGTNGTLSKSYVELIVQQHPDFFMFENVKGLWRTKVHRAFYEELKKKLLAAGYALTERLVNSMQFGVPQDRERIILVGFSKKKFGGSLPMDLESRFPWGEFSKYKTENLLSKVWPEATKFKENSEREKPSDIIEEITVEYWFRKNRVEEHPNAPDFFKPRAGLPRFKSVDEGDDSRKSFKRLHRWRYSPTAAYGNNEVHLHPYKARRITVAEAMAIQSMPREFVLPSNMSLSNKFKAVGNGVPYLLARSIAMSIKNFLQILQ